jgi:hypothetical protein
MAADEWVPRRFKNLSDRLVTQNGVLAMGIAAGVVLWYTGGAVGLLVVMYSINVFLTFTLSQTGMALHWLKVRRQERHWRRRLIVAVFGAVVTGTILTVMIALKFLEGGWVTLLATGGLIAVCFAVRKHYRDVRRHLRTIDEALLDLPLPEIAEAKTRSPNGPTAVMLVESYGGLGVHTFLWIHRLFPEQFKDFVFVAVGLVDSAQFKGVQELGALEARVRGDLEKYVGLARRLGFYAESRYALGTDVTQELETMCTALAADFPSLTVFAGRLVFQRELLVMRSLHDQTAYSIQRRLLFHGIPVIILPVRVWDIAAKT